MRSALHSEMLRLEATLREHASDGVGFAVHPVAPWPYQADEIEAANAWVVNIWGTQAVEMPCSTEASRRNAETNVGWSSRARSHAAQFTICRDPEALERYGLRQITVQYGQKRIIRNLMDMATLETLRADRDAIVASLLDKGRDIAERRERDIAILALKARDEDGVERKRHQDAFATGPARLQGIADALAGHDCAGEARRIADEARPGVATEGRFKRLKKLAREAGIWREGLGS